MTREEIICIAWEVGFEIDEPANDVWISGGHWADELERFAALVAAAAKAEEREACAKAADDRKHLYPEVDVDYHYNQACTHCAAAIRARGEK